MFIQLTITDLTITAIVYSCCETIHRTDTFATQTEIPTPSHPPDTTIYYGYEIDDESNLINIRQIIDQVGSTLVYSDIPKARYPKCKTIIYDDRTFPDDPIPPPPATP